MPMKNILTSIFALALSMVPINVIAQAVATAPVPSTSEALMRSVPMMLIIFGIFYFLVLRPQTKQQQEALKMRSALKKGDEVVTSSGIIAKVVSIDADTAILEVAPNVRVKFELSAIAKQAGSSEKNKES